LITLLKRLFPPRMSTNSVKLEVQNVGMDLIRDAIERKGGKGKKRKQQRLVVAMMRYQGSRQMGKVLPGRRPKEAYEKGAATFGKVSKTMMVNRDGDVFQPEVKRVKLFTDFCGKLEDLSIGNMEEVLVDGFLFQSFIEASDFPPMQLMCKFEENEIGKECPTLTASHPGPCCNSAVKTLVVDTTFPGGTWGRTSLGRRSTGNS